MISIFTFSSDTGSSSSKKSRFLVNIVVSITNKKCSEEEIETITFVIRKLAHFTIYFVLGFLLISLFREYLIIDKRIFIIMILLCMMYACSDEIHQLFVSDRSGEVRDVLIDTVGSTIGLVTYKKIFLNKKDI